MGLKTAEEYKASLDDGRIVYYKGERVGNVVEHPDLGGSVNTMSLDYELAHDPKYRDLAVVEDPELGEPVTRYYYKPKNAQDLLKAHELIVTSTTLSDGIIPFAHDIGADTMNAISITANMIGNRDYIERIHHFRNFMKKNDIAAVSAVTDVKGDRMLRPSDPGQSHGDYYVRVVNKNKEGIIVRGAKIHITGAAYAQEIFVIPCRQMTEVDKDYAVAFAIPPNTKGITQVCRPYRSSISPLEFPNDRPFRSHTDSLIIFDDVFVPWERVFLCGEWDYSAQLVYNFALLHRRTACAYRVPMSENLLGVAKAIAEYNGIAKASHVKEKLTEFVIYLETLKSLSKAACFDFVMHGDIAVPNPVTTNIAKYHFATNYHDMVKIIQDFAGGLTVTAPTYKDYQHPDLHEDIDKYLGGKKGIPTENRLRMFDLIRRLTDAEYETICIHAEGSPIAEKMMIFLEGQEILARCQKHVEEMAGISTD
jgi:4-hydroxybutyryl-CoA dehydratase / vinylacetyl-CoA-Delta-isomerase